MKDIATVQSINAVQQKHLPYPAMPKLQSVASALAKRWQPLGRQLKA
jgi:hypothetical protein